MTTSLKVTDKEKFLAAHTAEEWVGALFYGSEKHGVISMDYCPISLYSNSEWIELIERMKSQAFHEGFRQGRLSALRIDE